MRTKKSITMSTKKVLAAMLLVSVILIAATGCGSVAGAGNSSEAPYIAVSGQGKVTAVPDQVQVVITIATEKNDASAQQDNAKKVQAVLDQLYAIGLTEEEVQTTGASFFPRTRWEDGREIPLGYRAENQLQVETKQMNLISDILDKSVAAGAERVGGLSFTLSDEARENLLADVLESAVADATSQAGMTLAALGQEVGGVKKIQVIRENNYPLYRSADMIAGKGEMEASTPVIPGDIDYQISIMAEFFVK